MFFKRPIHEDRKRNLIREKGQQKVYIHEREETLHACVSKTLRCAIPITLLGDSVVRKVGCKTRLSEITNGSLKARSRCKTFD